MYTSYFQLSQLPFEGAPDRRFYYVGNHQHKSLEMLSTSLERKGTICVLTGEAGSGKTTLVRMLIKSLPTRMRIIAIDDPRLEANELLVTILLSCGISATIFETTAELTYKIRKMLESLAESEIITTVIIDEAQGLSDEVLEQIRLLYNIEGVEGKMLNFLLVGQNSLLDNLNKDMHKMFVSRIKTFCNIPALQKDEVFAYINFRLVQAGCHEPLFTDRALELLYKKTKGLPRSINQVADMALCLAYKKGKNRVDTSILKKASLICLNEKTLLRSIFESIYFNLRNIDFYSKASVILFALLLSVVLFATTLTLGKYIFKDRFFDNSIDVALNFDDRVKSAYNVFLDNVIKGKSSENRLFYKLNKDIYESSFKSEALDNLVKILGFQKQDGEASSCTDIDAINLKCTMHKNSLSSLIDTKSRAVISLLDENLVPFYAVLMYIDKDMAQLMLGSRIWSVKREFLDSIYNDEYVLIYDKRADDPLLYVANELYSDDKGLIDYKERLAKQGNKLKFDKNTAEYLSDSLNKFIETLSVTALEDYYGKYYGKKLESIKTSFESKFLKTLAKESGQKLKDLDKDAILQSEEYKKSLSVQNFSEIDKSFLSKLKSCDTEAIHLALKIYIHENFKKDGFIDIESLALQLYMVEKPIVITKKVGA